MTFLHSARAQKQVMCIANIHESAGTKRKKKFKALSKDLNKKPLLSHGLVRMTKI